MSRSQSNGKLPMSAVARLRHEIKERIAPVVAKEPCKVIAMRWGVTEREIAGLRRKEHGPSAAVLMLACRDDAELRAWWAQYMNFTYADDPRAAELLRQIEKFAADKAKA